MAEPHAHSQPIETYSLAPHNRNIWPSPTPTANQYKHMAQRRIIETYGHTIAGRRSFVTPSRFFCLCWCPRSTHYCCCVPLPAVAEVPAQMAHAGKTALGSPVSFDKMEHIKYLELRGFLPPEERNTPQDQKTRAEPEISLDQDDSDIIDDLSCGCLFC